MIRQTLFAALGLIVALTSRSNAAEELISVGGTYSTAVTLGENSCGSGITVEPRPTVIVHTPGADSLTLEHAILHKGKVEATGAFTAGPTSIQDTERHTEYKIQVAGVFFMTGFKADATVDQTDTKTSATCRYTVHWVGTKQGSPNVLPKMRSN